MEFFEHIGRNVIGQSYGRFVFDFLMIFYADFQSGWDHL